MKLVFLCVEFVYSFVRLLLLYIIFDFLFVLFWDNEVVVLCFFIIILFLLNVKIYIDCGYYGN